ncbi:MAG: hypothetical protein IPI49_27110 [Myxococcales bacterium]|nr:hypothetical protein [Myxococcales bacterium]
MKQAVALSVVLLASLTAASAHAEEKDKAYTLADLEALIAAKSYQEAIVHLGDIRPAERKDKWLTIATDAATGFLSSITGDHIYTRVMLIEEIDGMYPQLLGAAKYKKVRAELGLAAYSACFAETYRLDDCIQHATKFLDGDPSNTDLALKVGKALRRNSNPYVAAPILARGIGKKPSEAVCKDADVKLATIAGLALPEDHVALPGAKEIAFGPCFPQLKGAILEAFDAGSEGGYVRTNTCPLLIAKKALGGERLRSCK